MRVRDGFQRYVLDRHPFDVVGWDGYVYPYTFNADDFEPRAGRFHLPPPAHQTFQGPNFVICTFAPRMLDWDETAVPLPYHHSNIQSEEVMFYAEGDYAARKGVEIGCLTLHPSGLPHGPQPGAVEKALGAKSTDELAVMWDTFRPLRLTTLWQRSTTRRTRTRGTRTRRRRWRPSPSADRSTLLGATPPPRLRGTAGPEGRRALAPGRFALLSDVAPVGLAAASAARAAEALKVGRDRDDAEQPSVAVDDAATRRAAVARASSSPRRGRVLGRHRRLVPRELGGGSCGIGVPVEVLRHQVPDVASVVGDQRHPMAPAGGEPGLHLADRRAGRQRMEAGMSDVGDGQSCGLVEARACHGHTVASPAGPQARTSRAAASREAAAAGRG